ncbi:Alpha/beta hydrolase fold [Parasponia andersonii]|uniref:(S)-hydroxynitrile lyase n=1 Tax=Parasponia andersonii TaxID=3476 RepID=A0A2P5BZ35_PARAD|nr:Alpha/beta hydrolase fold [Parasponia andersonii]
MRRFLALVSLVACLLTLSSNVNATKHFVLVHGAAHGAWCWYKVATLLESVGHNVTALDLTASGVNPSHVRQVKPLTDFLASLPDTADKVVLVGHSLGGLSISLAIESFPHKISVAIFISAFMPGPSLSYLAIYNKTTQEEGYFMDSQFIYDEGPNNPPTALHFGPNFIASRLYKLSPPEDLVLALSLARPFPLFYDQKLVTKEVKLTEERYGSVPRVFIMCDQDNGLEVSLQKWMIERNPPLEVRVINGTDHMVIATKPLKIFSNLIEIAEKYSYNSLKLIATS